MLLPTFTLINLPRYIITLPTTSCCARALCCIYEKILRSAWVSFFQFKCKFFSLPKWNAIQMQLACNHVRSIHTAGRQTTHGYHIRCVQEKKSHSQLPRRLPTNIWNFQWLSKAPHSGSRCFVRCKDFYFTINRFRSTSPNSVWSN